MPKINAKEISLAELLRTGRFSVPRHQRYYDWGVEHVDALLHDFAEAASADSDCHFLGSIMLINGNKEKCWEINDGQQRIITFSLMCAYLCRFFVQEGQSSEESDILRVLFDIGEGHGKKLHDADSMMPRITPPENNKTDFHHLIRGHDVGINGKLVDAWKKIVSFFDEKEHQPLAWRKNVLGFMLNSVIVIRLEVDQSLDANAIFETLNYRGKQVGQMDLIKNHFLQSFNDDPNNARIDTINTNFDKIYTGFSSNVEVVGEYVRCYMQTEIGFIKKERFLRETKKHFRGMGAKKCTAIFSLVDRLSDGESFQAFKTFLRKTANPEVLDKLTVHARQTNARRKIRDYLLDMHAYSITRPAILALFLLYLNAPDNKKQSSARIVYKCIKLLASFMQRVVHVGGFTPTQYEEKFANLAKRISNGSCRTADAFFDALKSYDRANIISDKNYIASMQTNFSLQNETVLAYLVRRVAEQQEGVPIADGATSIEHILPKSPKHRDKPAWVADIPDSNDRMRFSRVLGNLALLKKGEDRSTESDNESFAAKKKKIYAKSSYVMIKDLCQHNAWTLDVIKGRQCDLAKIAAQKVWNFLY